MALADATQIKIYKVPVRLNDYFDMPLPAVVSFLYHLCGMLLFELYHVPAHNGYLNLFNYRLSRVVCLSRVVSFIMALSRYLAWLH